MRILLFMLISSFMLVSLVACDNATLSTSSSITSQEEQSSDTQSEAESSKIQEEDTSDISQESKQEIVETEDDGDYLLITLQSIDGDYAQVKYKDDGVHIEFYGSNEFANGYAFFENSKGMFGEGIFYLNGKDSGDSQPIYTGNDGYSSVIISTSTENFWDNGLQYYLAESEAEFLKESIIGNEGETQHWVSTDIILHATDLNEKIVPQTTSIDMSTTYSNGQLSLTMQGNGEYIFDGHSAVLNVGDSSDYVMREYSYAGENYIAVIPEGDFLTVSIEYLDMNYGSNMRATVKFEKSNGSTSTQQPDDNSDPIVFVDSEMERIISEYLDIPVGEINKDHMSKIEVLSIYENALYDGPRNEEVFFWDTYNTGTSGNITTLDDLQYCANLKELYIGKNQINDISALSDLTQLTVINLTTNQISDISPLRNLTSLEKLTLDHNNISDASSLIELENLKLLDLGYNNDGTFNDIESISKMTTLESLTLYQNAFTDISLLSNLTDLEFLSLSTNDITDVSPLTDLTNLKTLYLGQNFNLSDISPLNNLNNLEFLSIRRTAVTNADQIPNLVENNAEILIEDE